MKNTIFTGSGVALVTPMHPDGSVNYDKLKELIDFQINSGTDAIIACGTTGESAVLTHEEHVEVIKTTVKHTAGRVPVIAGTGSNDTAYAINLCKEAEQLGADALLMVTPYYNKTSQAGLVAHYLAVADQVSTPIILYNVPSRTGLGFKSETYARLAEHKNIAAIKEANGDISSIAKTLSLCGDHLALYSGNDDQILPIMALGGVGVISVLANVCPKEVHDICRLYLDGKTQESTALYFRYLEMSNVIFEDVSPIPIKEAMNLMGMEVGGCRLPLVPIQPAAKEKLTAAMQKVGLL